MSFDPDNLKLHLVDTLDSVNEFWAWLTSGHSIMGYDIETDGLNWYDGKIRLVQFGALTEGWAIPYELWPGLCAQALEYIKEQRMLLVGHNVGGFDLMWARRHMAFVPDWSLVHDSQITSALLDSAGIRKLKTNAAMYVHECATLGEKALKEDMARGGWTWATVPFRLPSYWAYGVLDTILTVNLFMVQYEEAERQGLIQAYETERHCEKALHQVSWNGLLVDLDHCYSWQARLRNRIDEIAAQVQVEYGLDNIGSGPQLAQAFVNTGVVLTEKTETGKWSMSSDSLEIIAAMNNEHPLVALVTEYRRSQKFLGTYFDNFVKYRRSDGRCHPSYNQLQARTLRMSANDPPIQTVPRPDQHPEVRNAFISAPGKSFISADFSNVEARLFACLAQDPGMMKAFRDGVDLHCWTGGQMYEGGRVLEKSDPRRQKSKNSLFTTLFGGGAGKLAVTAGIPTDEALVTLNLLKRTFPSIQRYSKEMQLEAASMLAETGRAGIRLSDGRILRMGEDDDRFYAFVNYSIQGTARMVLAERLAALDRAGLMEYGVAVIHDEVVFELPDEYAEDARADIGDYMSDYEQFDIPIVASVGHPAKRFGETEH